MTTHACNREHPRGVLLGLLIAAVALASPGRPAGADAPPAGAPAPEATPAPQTAAPPRLRFTDGAVSFWRPGAEDWVTAQVNTPLAAGDDLYAADGANAEVEVAGQTFLRAGADSEVGLESLDADFLQVKVTSGHLAFDLARLQPGHRIEIDTPNAAFDLEQGGYYRVDIDGDSTALLVRRGGKATVFPPVGDPVDVGGDQKARVVGTDAPKVELGAVPSLDPWDRWNIQRHQPAGNDAAKVAAAAPPPASPPAVAPAAEPAPDHPAPPSPPEVPAAGAPPGVPPAGPTAETPPEPAAAPPADALSSPPPPGRATPPIPPPASADYVSDQMAGSEDLADAGDWHDDPGYGHVWVPHGVSPGWAPYTTGHWILDPSYGWSWVDDAPWGWAPYHYGRWAVVDGTWAWVPGPVVAPVYSPALVAFLDDGDGGGGPDVGWVALGYGEPVIPWWGGAGVVGVAYWNGWGGPRVVNNEVISNTTVVNVRNITRYKNVSVTNAVVAVDRGHFGRAGGGIVHLSRERAAALHPVRGHLDVKPTPASLVAGTAVASRPPERIANRAVVATRAPQDPGARLHAAGLNGRPARASGGVRVVSAVHRPAAPSPGVPGSVGGPAPGPGGVEHAATEPRMHAPPPPRLPAGGNAPPHAPMPPGPPKGAVAAIRPTAPGSPQRTAVPVSAQPPEARPSPFATRPSPAASRGQEERQREAPRQQQHQDQQETLHQRQPAQQQEALRQQQQHQQEALRRQQQDREEQHRQAQQQEMAQRRQQEQAEEMRRQQAQAQAQARQQQEAQEQRQRQQQQQQQQEQARRQACLQQCSRSHNPGCARGCQ